jgi:ubiquinone/menaquinone biosynthesis C-methylase UbiE
MIPWYVKIPAKVVLSRLPVSGKAWQKLYLFRAGGMDNDEYARSIFNKHFDATGFSDLANKTILEIGPGNGLITGKYANELGAAKTWLIDSEPIAEVEPFPNTIYLTEGLKSFREVPDASVDFLFSNAVLEHIRLREFAPLVMEMKRVLKPEGTGSHQIDFRDHLQYALNNLRFSERIWESEFMAKSGFYTNRIPWAKMQAILEEHFSVRIKNRNSWPSLPTAQKKMSSPFNAMPEQDLMTLDCHVVITNKFVDPRL